MKNTTKLAILIKLSPIIIIISIFLFVLITISSTVINNLYTTSHKTNYDSYITDSEINLPLKQLVVTSSYGQRWGRLHKGTDYDCVNIADDGAREDDLIYVILPGKVTYVRDSVQYGNIIKIDHGVVNGKHLESIYIHMYKNFVSVSDKVEKGEALGVCGTTGRSTGTHLHLELKVDGEYVDPHKFFE